MMAWSGVGGRSRREQEQNRNRRATTTPSAKERHAPAGTPLMICFWGPRISIRTAASIDSRPSRCSPPLFSRYLCIGGVDRGAYWVPIGGPTTTAVGKGTAASSARRRLLPCAMRRHHGGAGDDAGAGPKEEQRQYHGRWGVSVPPMVAAPSVWGVVGPVDRVARQRRISAGSSSASPMSRCDGAALLLL